MGDLPKPEILGVDLARDGRDFSALLIGRRDPSGRIVIEEFIDDPDAIAERLGRPTSPPAGDR